MIINKGIKRQIDINKKLSNPVEIEEENQFADRVGYYVFAFLFRILMAAGRPRFCLVLQDRVVGGQTI